MTACRHFLRRGFFRRAHSHLEFVLKRKPDHAQALLLKAELSNDELADLKAVSVATGMNGVHAGATGHIPAIEAARASLALGWRSFPRKGAFFANNDELGALLRTRETFLGAPDASRSFAIVYTDPSFLREYDFHRQFSSSRPACSGVYRLDGSQISEVQGNTDDILVIVKNVALRTETLELIFDEVGPQIGIVRVWQASNKTMPSALEMVAFLTPSSVLRLLTGVQAEDIPAKISTALRSRDVII